MTTTLSGYETGSAIDWLTVTSTALNVGNRLLDTYAAYKTGKEASRTFYGFECLRSETGLMWGKRPKDGRYILIAPGDLAQSIFLKLAPLPVKVTRIDLACDVWLDAPRDQVRHSARVPMSKAHESKTKTTLIRGVGGGKRERVGDTLYLGSRQSQQFGRMYDKGLQQKTTTPGKWFRYEVEYKAEAARQIANVARCLKPLQFGEWIRCTVHDWFLLRAVPPLFAPDTETPGTTIRSQMKQTTPEKKIAWLRTQVRPTIKYLLEQGLKNEMLDALGMSLVEIGDGVYNTISGSLEPEKLTVRARGPN